MKTLRASLAASALLLAAAASAAWLALPAYGTGAGALTLAAANGVPHTLLVLAVPVAIAAVPFLFGRFRWRAALSLLAFASLSGASIGLWYWPAVIRMIAAAMAGQPPPGPPRR